MEMLKTITTIDITKQDVLNEIRIYAPLYTMDSINNYFELSLQGHHNIVYTKQVYERDHTFALFDTITIGNISCPPSSASPRPSHEADVEAVQICCVCLSGLSVVLATAFTNASTPADSALLVNASTSASASAVCAPPTALLVIAACGMGAAILGTTWPTRVHESNRLAVEVLAPLMPMGAVATYMEKDPQPYLEKNGSQYNSQSHMTEDH